MIKVTKNKRLIKSIVEITKQNHLMYVDGGFNSLFKSDKFIDKILCAAIIYYNNAPIGVAFTTENNAMWGYNVGVFIKTNLRRRGFGKLLFSRLYKHTLRYFPNYKMKYSSPFYSRIMVK